MTNAENTTTTPAGAGSGTGTPSGATVVAPGSAAGALTQIGWFVLGLSSIVGFWAGRGAVVVLVGRALGLLLLTGGLLEAVRGRRVLTAAIAVAGLVVGGMLLYAGLTE